MLNETARAFLDRNGWGGAAGESLTGDASARQYTRLRMANRTAILMDASRLPEVVPPFILIAGHLRQMGLSVPEIMARDEANGLLLLENFGDATFAQLLDGGGEPERYYALATDVLIALHQNPAAIPSGLRAYSPEKMLEDLELFLTWRAPGLSAAGQEEFRQAWREVLPVAHQVPASLLLRDFHVANLMLLPAREGVRQVGLLDFQDAYQGPVTYDLVSLLEDARRDVPEPLRKKMMARYLDQFPSLDRGAFEASAAILAAVRHTRVLAIFEKLAGEGKPDYKRAHSPRVECLLQAALRHPKMAGVKRWFDENGKRIKTAMVLAAGYGTRLRPLTDRVPKPLVPVAGRPMIDYALEKLERHGVGKIVVNVSHQKEQLIAHLSARKNPDIAISTEPEPLETGGGLKHAQSLLGDDPLFVINSDIIWTDDSETALDRLERHWDGARMDFLLLVQSKARAVGHDQGEDHLFIKPGNTIGWNEADAPYIVAGVGVIHPRVLAGAPEGKFSVKVLWRRALEQGRLFCLPHRGRWFQTGTVADIAKVDIVLNDTKWI